MIDCRHPRIIGVVPPELRRLRLAWSWARRNHACAAAVAEATPILAETDLGGDVWTMTGTTRTGGGVSILLASDRLILMRVEEDVERYQLLLPAELCAGAMAPRAM